MSDDDLDGIFDDLTPEDFEIDTTAISEISRENRGVEAFNAFVDEQIRALRMAYSAGAGHINPVTTIANAQVQRLFLPNSDETLGDYFERLHDEAEKMQGSWLFIARRTQVGSHLIAPSEMHDATQSPVIQEAEAAGMLKDGVIWYGESRETGEIHRRLGILFDDGHGNLERPVESPPEANQRMELFERILG